MESKTLTVSLKKPVPVARGQSSPPEKAGGPAGKKKSGAKSIALLVLPTLVLVLAVLFMLYAARQAGGYRFEGAAVQYYANQTFAVPSGARLSREPNGVTVLNGEQLTRQMNSMPVYYAARQAVVLPQDMIYFEPREVLCVRLDHFTELTVQANGAVSARRKKSEAALQRGFLFDGSNLYLFLEPVTLSFNGYTLELGALAYVEANFVGDVTVYDHATGEMLMEAPTGPVTAHIATGDYSVSLLSDSMTLHDGAKTLLFNRPDQLQGVL